MNFNHLDDTIRLVFRKTMLSAEKQIWGEASTGNRKTGSETIGERDLGEDHVVWVEALVAIQGWERCWNLGICWIWKKRERERNKS